MSDEVPTITLDLLVEILKEVIAERASRDRVETEAATWGRETLLEEAGFNSYDFVEIIFKLEDQFGIDIDYNANNNINDVKTIGDLCDEVAKLLAKKQAA